MYLTPMYIHVVIFIYSQKFRERGYMYMLIKAEHPGISVLVSLYSSSVVFWSGCPSLLLTQLVCCIFM